MYKLFLALLVAGSVASNAFCRDLTHEEIWYTMSCEDVREQIIRVLTAVTLRHEGDSSDEERDEQVERLLSTRTDDSFRDHKHFLIGSQCSSLRNMLEKIDKLDTREFLDMQSVMKDVRDNRTTE